jgi:ribosomal protein S18 acetylase RimI-like enzyme
MRLWLAEIDPGAAPVGYAMISPPDLPIPVGADDLELRRIYLLSRFHGQGWGAKLMSTAIEAARRSGARHLLLGVNDENRRALAFYARQGFAAVGRRQFQVGAHAYHDLVLARAL